MATKKITLNELKKLVKQIIKEEEGIIPTIPLFIQQTAPLKAKISMEKQKPSPDYEIIKKLTNQISKINRERDKLNNWWFDKGGKEIARNTYNHLMITGTPKEVEYQLWKLAGDNQLYI